MCKVSLWSNQYFPRKGTLKLKKLQKTQFEKNEVLCLRIAQVCLKWTRRIHFAAGFFRGVSETLLGVPFHPSSFFAFDGAIEFCPVNTLFIHPVEGNVTKHTWNNSKGFQNCFPCGIAIIVVCYSIISSCSAPTNVVLGQRHQMSWFSDSLVFWVLPWRHFLRRAGSDNAWTHSNALQQATEKSEVDQAVTSCTCAVYVKRCTTMPLT